MRLLLSGDVMTGRGIDQILPHPGDPRIHESWLQSAVRYVELTEETCGHIPLPVPFDYIWGDALGEMDRRKADFRVINLETAVTRSDDFWPGKGINYRMHPANLPCLTAAGVDICGLANNHVLDWGYAGLEETLQSLRAAGLLTAGAGMDARSASAPVVANSGRGRLLFYACGHGSSGIPPQWAAADMGAGVNRLRDLSGASAAQIAEQLGRLRQPGDLVCVSIHWGGNWGYGVPEEQREFAHRLIGAGVDIVCGHSSHHPRGIEVYRGRPILYGCGDLINDYEGISGHEEYRPNLRVLYCIEMDPGGRGLQSAELIPFESRRLRLQRPAAADCDWLCRTLDRECRALGAGLEPAQDGCSYFLRWPG